MTISTLSDLLKALYAVYNEAVEAGDDELADKLGNAIPTVEKRISDLTSTFSQADVNRIFGLLG